MPEQDEALKTLVQRFRRAPESDAFIALAAQLHARGHATDALRIVDHGLGVRPDALEARAERAAILLSLDRPRSAYVELCRVLAAAPDHRRAQRLLGQALVQAGRPERAANLLSLRAGQSRRTSDDADTAHDFPGAAALQDRAHTIPSPTVVPMEEPATDHHLPPGARPPELSTLFAGLTEDLGLPATERVPAHSAVEVTQVIRRRAVMRRDSELRPVRGPIVDTARSPRPPRTSAATDQADTAIVDRPEIGERGPAPSSRADEAKTWSGPTPTPPDTDESPQTAAPSRKRRKFLFF